MTTVYNVEDESLTYAEEWLTGYIENRNPDLAYRSREYYKAEFESLRRTYMMLGGGMAFILAMIGILNFINAVFTSITARRTELAMCCPCGAHLEKQPNRFQRMELTHPERHDYFINTTTRRILRRRQV